MPLAQTACRLTRKGMKGELSIYSCRKAQALGVPVPSVRLWPHFEGPSPYSNEARQPVGSIQAAELLLVPQVQVSEQPPASRSQLP